MISRTDAQIADALKQAAAEDKNINSETRAEIILQGIFGPCFNPTARTNQFEIDWMRREHELNDRSKDVQLALVGIIRMAKLFREHKIPLEGRSTNVFFSRFKPSDTSILYTVHWPSSVISRAMATQQKAEELLRNGYVVADGDEPPREWFIPQCEIRSRAATDYGGRRTSKW